MNGDWDVRGIDFETYLCGEITPKIIDADRIARSHVNNGFPNWALYRTVYAGDSHMRQMVRDWCVAFAISAAEAGLVRKGLPHEEMGALASQPAKAPISSWGSPFRTSPASAAEMAKATHQSRTICRMCESPAYTVRYSAQLGNPLLTWERAIRSASMIFGVISPQRYVSKSIPRTSQSPFMAAPLTFHPSCQRDNL